MFGLLSANVESTLMEVFIILGVVIAASLIIYFIWEAVLSYSAKKRGGDKKEGASTDSKISKESNVESYTFEEEPKLLEGGNVVDVDTVKAEQEEQEINDAEAEEERLNRERREYLERRRQELIRKLQEEQEAEEEEQEQPVEEVEEEPEEVEDSDEETYEEEEEEEEVEEESEEETQDDSAEEIARLEAEKEELLKEKERYEAMCKALEEEKQQLLESVQEQNLPIVVAPNLSLDDLRQRLQDAEEKLKANEKDLKQCKKDFVPLNRIWKTHEKDKKKLERKEAKVAKQKVMLYGVNNYEDIDEEKARKLAEDLDLYDGLKLSVQHCEEVMEKNADRYPLLKKMYEVLKRQNTELKEEIATLREQIAELEEEEGANSVEEE